MQVEGVWGSDVTVVLAGLTNTYSSYVTTFEEYAVQRYEGASTIFGPHTLDAYIQVSTAYSSCVEILLGLALQSSVFGGDAALLSLVHLWWMLIIRSK